MANQFDLLLYGGIVVNGNGLSRHDIAIREGQIVRVEPDIPPQSALRVIDVKEDTGSPI